MKSLINIPQLSDFYIALKCNAGLDQQIYNLPTTSEVAGIWVEQDTNNCIPTPHIRIFLRHISEYIQKVIEANCKLLQNSSTTTISDEHAEKILLLTSEEVYDICNVKVYSVT